MLKTRNRPRILSPDQLGTAVRAGVALAMEERVKCFGPNALFPTGPSQTSGPPMADPDPLDPSYSPYLAE
jgi:hypothetical protein